MNNRKYQPSEGNGYFMKLAQIDGISFVMQVTEHVTPEGRTDYKCFGYARLNSQNIADWTYWALEAEEAESVQTREYLLRELMPLVRIWAKNSLNSVRIWSESGHGEGKYRHIWLESGLSLPESGQNLVTPHPLPSVI